MTFLALEFRQPNAPLSMNEAKGTHWAILKRRLDPWQELAWVTARNHLVRQPEGIRGHMPVPVIVQVELDFAQARRRDAHNYTGTVVKAIIDGLVRSSLVPDDTPEWVTVSDPILTVSGSNRCRVIITPRKA